jgi:hypothetical protein
LTKSSSIYRQTKARQPLKLDVSPSFKLQLGLAIAATSLFVVTLTFGLLGTCWVHDEAWDPTCSRSSDSDIGCGFTRYEESLLFVNPRDTWLAPTDEAHGRVMYIGSVDIPAILLLLAVLCVLGPHGTREKASLTLDEHWLSLRRYRAGELEETVWPIREIAHAVILRHGEWTVAQLVRANGEKIDLSEPSRAADHADRIVAAISVASAAVCVGTV